MAIFFNWNPIYSVGIEKIDEQHKKLLDIINELYAAFMAKKTKEITNDIIAKLVDYTHYHFSFEEQMLVESNYTELNKHKELHSELVKKLNGFKHQIENENIDITYNLMNFLRSWLIDHIQGEDKKYMSTVLENK